MTEKFFLKSQRAIFYPALSYMLRYHADIVLRVKQYEHCNRDQNCTPDPLFLIVPLRSFLMPPISFPELNSRSAFFFYGTLTMFFFFFFKSSPVFIALCVLLVVTVSTFCKTVFHTLCESRK